MPTKIMTNYGTYHVNAENHKALDKWMYKYLRAWKRKYGTIKGAQYVMSRYSVTTPISTIPLEFRDLLKEEEEEKNETDKRCFNDHS